MASDAEYLTRWLEIVLDGKSERTRESYVYVARRLLDYLRSEGYPLDLRLLKPVHLRAFFANVRAAGVSANSLALFDRTLRAIFNRLEREGREDFDLPKGWRSPLAAVDKAKPRGMRKEPLSVREAKRLLAETPRAGFIGYRNYAQLAFMLMTGARSIEVRSVQIEDIDLERKLALLRVTKGGKPRVVYLPSKLVRILESYSRRRERRIRETPYFFPTRSGGPQSSRSLYRTVQRAGARIGRDDIGPHRLRHSYVTLSHANGAPLKFLQEQCGHSSVLVTQGYITLSHEQKAELAEKYA